MIALDPIILEFYQGNVLALSILISAMGFLLKLLALLSKNESNKVLDFLTHSVEGVKNKLTKKSGGKP